MHPMTLARLKESATPLQVTIFLDDSDIRIEQRADDSIYMAYIGNYSQEHRTYDAALDFIVDTLNKQPQLIPEGEQ